jgi:hypothetical protein
MAKKDPLDKIIDAAVTKWRKTVEPTLEALAGFEAIEKLLRKYIPKGVQAKTQEFPPKYELTQPAKKGKHDWDFASVAAVADDVYFDLYPLGLDCALRNQVSPGLQKYSYRPDDGFKIPKSGEKFLQEIGRLIQIASDWFQREIVPSSPLPPCQLLDQYLIEIPGSDDSDWDMVLPETKWEPLKDNENQILPRLVKAFGKGNWKGASMITEALLPGWSKTCQIEVHWYTRHKTPNSSKKRGQEAWKIKQFLKCQQKEQSSDCELIYAANSDFRASLEPGATYHCSAMLGRKFQSYVRIRDESGEEYWYPERFFVPK